MTGTKPPKPYDGSALEDMGEAADLLRGPFRDCMKDAGLSDELIATFLQYPLEGALRATKATVMSLRKHT